MSTKLFNRHSPPFKRRSDGRSMRVVCARLLVARRVKRALTREPFMDVQCKRTFNTVDGQSMPRVFYTRKCSKNRFEKNGKYVYVQSIIERPPVWRDVWNVNDLLFLWPMSQCRNGNGNFRMFIIAVIGFSGLDIIYRYFSSARLAFSHDVLI